MIELQLGRYPPLPSERRHEWLIVRGLAIHETFNRAVNVHGSHTSSSIEHTVIYNVMGGAFFLEDGIETNNHMSTTCAVCQSQFESSQ
ncbi:PKHD1L1 [Bugula neritina]|uniref:PKHD1L1 n=1 Tax=Bugula neritina TaxID=10212 RepID=A0A7J7KCH9_BUGNE|nr:PKHD1L1 [Bugula neritina]